MKKVFLFHAGLLFLLNLLIKPFYLFFIDRQVQNLLGPESYGIFFLIFNFAYLFSLACDLGTHHYALTKVSEQNDRFSYLMVGILQLRMVGAFIYGLLLFGLGFYLGYLDYGYWFLVIGITMFLISSSLFLRAQLQALGHFTTESILSVLDKALLTLVLGYYILFYPDNLNLDVFIGAQLLVWTLVCLIIGGLLFRVAPSIQWQKRIGLKSLLQKTLPFALILVLMLVYNRIDVVMLKMLHPHADTEAGIYAAGYRILDFLNMSGFMIGSLSIPMFARLQGKSLRELLQTCFDLMWWISIVAALGIWFYRDPISTFLYWEATSYWADILGILCLNFIFLGTGYVFSSFLTARQQLKVCTLLFSVAIFINVSFNFLLIPKYGALGAAYTTLATQLLVVCGLYYYCRQYFSKKIIILQGNHLIFALLVGLLFAIGLYFSTHILTYAGVTILCTLLGIGMGFIHLADLKALLWRKTNGKSTK